MPPRKVAVDYPYSFARRSGTDLHVVLDLAASGDAAVSPEGEPPIVRFSSEGRAVRATGRVSQHGDRMRLAATVPWAKLGPGVWQLALRPSPDEQVRPLQARLLISRTRPLALLPGPVPPTRVEPPRTAAEQTPARRAFEVAVSRLPDRHARRVRSAARSAYRRVRG